MNTRESSRMFNQRRSLPIRHPGQLAQVRLDSLGALVLHAVLENHGGRDASLLNLRPTIANS